jgi:hypothetical protein
MLRRTLVLTAGLTVAIVAAAPAATVDYKRIQSPSKQIQCHAVIASAGGGIECNASYLVNVDPKADLDSYFQLKQHGKTIAGERGDYTGYIVKTHTLKYGNTWKRPGIRCSMKSSGLTCHNLDKHGFTLARGAIKRF